MADASTTEASVFFAAGPADSLTGTAICRLGRRYGPHRHRTGRTEAENDAVVSLEELLRSSFYLIKCGLWPKEKEENMRLDKYLKVSRLIKRRTVANEACDAGRVLINDKPAKASANVKAGDIITIQFGNKDVKVEVLDVQETVRKENAGELFKYL